VIRQAITTALKGAAEAIPGRSVAESAGLPYKATIDALGRMLDAGTVVRFGRKYSASWALAGTPAALRPDALAAVEAVWRGPATPAPEGGGASHPPAS
jgi:hypothetical protein